MPFWLKPLIKSQLKQKSLIHFWEQLLIACLAALCPLDQLPAVFIRSSDHNLVFGYSDRCLMVQVTCFDDGLSEIEFSFEVGFRMKT